VSRPLIYMAHPVAPTAEEIADRDHPTPVDAAINRNLASALRWLAWLRASFSETTFIAPWISVIQSLGGDDSPALREAGLVDDCTVVERCDGIVLVGGRISSGMARERDHGKANHLPDYFQVYDLTPPRIHNLIKYPTWSVLAGPSSLHDWYAAITSDSVPA
jgi:hypothetical protein